MGRESVSARRATPEARCVWLTEDWFGQMRVRLDQILGRAPSKQTWNHTRALIVLLDEAKAQWDVAPADPVEAAEMAFREWHREGPEKIGSGAVLHLLAALGYPDDSPRQETTT